MKAMPTAMAPNMPVKAPFQTAGLSSWRSILFRNCNRMEMITTAWCTTEEERQGARGERERARERERMKKRRKKNQRVGRWVGRGIFN